MMEQQPIHAPARILAETKRAAARWLDECVFIFSCVTKAEHTLATFDYAAAGSLIPGRKSPIPLLVSRSFTATDF